MSDRTKGSEPNLFDLPLQPPPAGEGRDRAPAGGERPRRARPARQAHSGDEETGLPLFPENGAEEGEAEVRDEGGAGYEAAEAGDEGAVDDGAWPFADRDEGAEGDAGAGISQAGHDFDDFVDRPAAAPGPRPVPDLPGAGRGAGGEPDLLRRREPAAATAALRLKAVAVDAGIHLLAAGLGAGAAVALGVPLGLADAYPFALFLLVFSFLYTVVTLAFWGRTPGMAAAGLTARSAGDQPLSFGQTGLRWLAGLLTVAALGLPLLFLLTRRSLADRVSGSETVRRG